MSAGLKARHLNLQFIFQKQPMPPPPDPTESRPREGQVMALQQRRLRQILWAVMSAFGVAALTSFSKGGYLSVGLELAAAALIGVAFRWNGQGQVLRAARLMLITLMVGLVALMAANEGLFDEAALALPAILVFAGMLGSRRLFTLLVA